MGRFQPNEKSKANLIPMGSRPKEDIHRITSAGGVASQKARREAKTLKEIINFLGNQDATPKEIEMFKNSFPEINIEEVSKSMMLMASMFHKGIFKQDVRAAEFLRDTAGEKPTTELTGTLTTEKIFITKEEKEQTLQHIKDVIADGGDR